MGMEKNVENFINDLQNEPSLGSWFSRLVSKLAIKNNIPLTRDQSQNGYTIPANAYNPNVNRK